MGSIVGPDYDAPLYVIGTETRDERTHPLNRPKYMYVPGPSVLLTLFCSALLCGRILRTSYVSTWFGYLDYLTIIQVHIYIYRMCIYIVWFFSVPLLAAAVPTEFVCPSTKIKDTGGAADVFG